jgi:replicative DNA helicase
MVKINYDEITLWVEENKSKNSPSLLVQANEPLSALYGNIKLSGNAITCVAARPGMGKTSFLVHLALEYAQKNSKTVYILSMKTSAEQFYNRMIISLAEVDEYEFRKNLLSEQDKEKIEISKKNMSQMNLIIDDTPYFSINEIEEKLENIDDIGLVLLNSFQSLIHKRKPSDRKKIGSEITRRIHLLATRKNIPIVFTSNVSRKADRRKDKKPRLSDFHGTGVSTYYTDTICFIYREGYYFHLDKTDEAEFIIRKNKFGPCGKTILKWKYAFMKFYEQTN